jgi:hypothetical protein
VYKTGSGHAILKERFDSFAKALAKGFPTGRQQGPLNNPIWDPGSVFNRLKIGREGAYPKGPVQTGPPMSSDKFARGVPVWKDGKLQDSYVRIDKKAMGDQKFPEPSRFTRYEFQKGVDVPERIKSNLQRDFYGGDKIADFDLDMIKWNNTQTGGQLQKMLEGLSVPDKMGFAVQSAKRNMIVGQYHQQWIKNLYNSHYLPRMNAMKKSKLKQDFSIELQDLLKLPSSKLKNINPQVLKEVPEFKWQLQRQEKIFIKEEPWRNFSEWTKLNREILDKPVLREATNLYNRALGEAAGDIMRLRETTIHRDPSVKRTTEERLIGEWTKAMDFLP